MFIIATSIFCLTLLIGLGFYLGYKKYIFRIERFTHHIILLEYYMEKAYEIIYRDKLMIYSIEAMKVSDEDFNSASKDFINLTRRMLGPTNYKYLTDFYGNTDTLFFIMAEYFNTKYEDDEIRKESKNELVDKEVDEQLNERMGVTMPHEQ